MEAVEDFTPTQEPGQAGAAVGPAPAAPDQETAISRVEFWRGINGVKHEIERETANVRVFIGWLLLTFSILGLLIGFQAMNPSKYRFSR